MTHPTDAEALIEQTDVYIRQIAEAADTALSARPTFAIPGTPTRTDGYGDIEIPFPGLSRIDGVMLHAHGLLNYTGQTAKARPPGVTVDLFMPTQKAFLVIYGKAMMNIRPGVVRAHVFIRAYIQPTGAHPYSFGMQRAAQGQTVQVGGIAWGAPA